jgi:hypothetical protein
MAKKLKRITSEVVSYVLIEGRAVKDANDKQLIVSYAHSYLNNVNWYIQLLETGSVKYEVQQTKAELLSVKSQLEAAIKEIIARPLPSSRGTIDIKYPKGYEG